LLWVAAGVVARGVIARGVIARGVVACGVVACGSEAPPADDALTVILPREAEQLDPRFVADPYGLKVSRLIFGSLVTIDPRTLEVVPDLAASVELEGDRRYRVVLKPGLRFSDGSVLDADDVIATFEGVVDPELGSLYARTYERIEGIEKVSASEVVFVLEAPHATFLTDLEIPIVRAEDARRRTAGADQPAPIGAGPYMLRERSAGALRLEANPHWHGGTPTHPALRLVTIRDDNTRALRLLGDAGDVAINAIPPLLLPLFEEDERFEIRSAPGVGTSYLGFHTERVELELREAIAQAVDRELLVRAELGGRARVADSWVPAGHWSSVALPTRAYDPAEARRRIAAAGATGRRLLLRTSHDRARLSISRAIAAMLEEVGLEVEVRPSETATLIADLNAGRFDLTFLQVPEVFEPHVLHWFFASERIPEGRAGANRWRLRDAELDAALERGRAVPGRDSRVAAYAQVQRILARELPVLPLWQDETVMVVRRGVDVDVPRDGRFAVFAR